MRKKLFPGRLDNDDYTSVLKIVESNDSSYGVRNFQLATDNIGTGFRLGMEKMNTKVFHVFSYDLRTAT